MHEMSLMQNLLSTAEQALEGQRVARVNILYVQAGLLANIMPAAFEFAFETLTSGTIFAGSRLELQTMPFSAVCNHCSTAYESMKAPATCPVCSSHDCRVTGGTEVILTAIDMEEAI